MAVVANGCRQGNVDGSLVRLKGISLSGNARGRCVDNPLALRKLLNNFEQAVNFKTTRMPSLQYLIGHLQNLPYCSTVQKI